MATHSGGNEVEGGCYVNAQTLALVWLPARGVLPGTGQDRFARIPWPLLLVAAPVAGGFYLLAMPVVGASMLAWGLVRKIAAAAGSGARDLAASLPPAHAVGEAHLTGKPGEGGPVQDESIEKLDQEIQERRDRP